MSLEALLPCFHDDFVGWGVGSTVPTTKPDRRPFYARDFETSEIVFQYLKPISVMVEGNMAVALYLATVTRKNKATGEESTTTERWTDVLLKRDGRWAWIADHGAPVSDDDD